MDDEINLREYMDVIKKRWKVIVLIAAVIVLFVFIFSSLQEPVYEAKTTILVKSSGESSLSNYANFAGAMGIRLSSSGSGLGNIINLLKTRAVAAKVVDDLRLRERIKGWDKPEIEDYKLASAVSKMLQKPKLSGNLVELKIKYKDPKLAAEIANGYASALSHYWNKLNYTETQKKRDYIESQLPRVGRELKIAEQKKKSFTLLSPKGGSSGSNLVGLVAGSQSEGIEISRLSRELNILTSVYTMLRKEYETVKLEESKEIPPLSIVDKAIVPEFAIGPRKKLNVIIGLVFGLFAGVFVVFFQEYLKKSGGK